MPDSIKFRALTYDDKKNKAIKKVIAWSNKNNIASLKILEHNGFLRIKQNDSLDNYLYQKILRN